MQEILWKVGQVGEMKLKQDYKLTTPSNETVYTVPGKKGEGDMKIFTHFPKLPWAHTLHYIGICLRLKGIVEDRDYPPPAKGKDILVDFCRDAITDYTRTISQICKDYQIPGY